MVDKINKDTSPLIEESINLELNISEIYLFFHQIFPKNRDLWWVLALEEKDHASIIQVGKEYFKLADIFPTELFHANLQNLKDINIELVSLIKTFKENPPSREEAFNTAFKIENLAGELEFQRFMDAEANSKVYQIFKDLNQYNKEHAMRLRSYMEKHGIPIQSESGQ
jgi:ferritin